MMDPKAMKQRLGELAEEVEDFLRECLLDRDIPEKLGKAMDYSLMAGGKRVRPVLCLAVAEMLGRERHEIMPFVAGLECVHTYSLIHDDLPAMDDDDLRRGKPSNHKKFGEAAAILAGDGLLTEAFFFMALTGETVPAELVLEALTEAALGSGAAGMVGGQALDMEYTGKDSVSLEELQAMHALKTGALIRASCVCGAILADAGDEDYARIEAFGEAVGAAFQIADDILDEVGDETQLGKPVGSDREQGKVTYPSLVGLDESRRMAEERVSAALEALKPFSGEQADFLRALARYIVDRTR